MKKNSSKENILIVCGEHSGDLLGMGLLENLPKEKYNFFGIGGDAMISKNFDSIMEIESLSVIGFSEIIGKYSTLKKIAEKLVDISIEKKVKYAILIDYPGFNLHLAEKLKEHGIKIIFYVSPQIWAWRFNRIYKIQKLVDLMLVLFPFEKKIYDSFNINCKFVGHPLSERMESKLIIEKSFKFNKKSKKICIMPGSRKSEIHSLLEPILISLKKLKINLGNKYKFEFYLPNINKKEEDFIKKIILDFPELEIKYFFDLSARCIKNSDLVILASGTATLEVAYFKKPMIILYKPGLITYLIGKVIIRTKTIGLINILSGKEICKELLQYHCNPESIFLEAKKIILDDKYRTEMIKEISIVKKSLGENGSKKASLFIQELIG